MGTLMASHILLYTLGHQQTIEQPLCYAVSKVHFKSVACLLGSDVTWGWKTLKLEGICWRQGDLNVGMSLLALLSIIKELNDCGGMLIGYFTECSKYMRQQMVGSSQLELQITFYRQ